jgi:hypothetical protein
VDPQGFASDLVNEMKKGRGKKKPLSLADLKRLKEKHGRSIIPPQALSRKHRTRSGKSPTW